MIYYKKGQKPRKFLSTPSARRATWGIVKGAKEIEFLSTPSARRATSQTEEGNT